jgi:hypothetical protein
MGKKLGFGSGMNNPDHISESLKKFWGLKYSNSLMWIQDPGWKNSDPGWKIVGSGIRDEIPDPQQCSPQKSLSRNCFI